MQTTVVGKSLAAEHLGNLIRRGESVRQHGFGECLESQGSTEARGGQENTFASVVSSQIKEN